MDSITVEIVLVVLGIVANGFFAGGEIALVSARIGRLTELRRKGFRGAAAALRLKAAPDAFLATIQIAITMVGTLASAIGGATAVEALTPWLARLGLGAWAQPVALGAVILLITYVSLVVGELTPKAVALRDPERLACRVAPVIEWSSRAAGAVVRLLTASTNALLFVLGQRSGQPSPFVSEEDVRYLVRAGAEKGIFEPVEEELVKNVFEFADTTVREVMTSRTAMKGVDVAVPPERLLAEVAAIGHSRVPVHEGAIDHVVGVLALKDVVRAAASGVAPNARALMQEPMFVPETARISTLLNEFQRSRQPLALVVDEHGTLHGLVTVDDVLGVIVGEIREVPRADEGAVRERPDGVLIVPGALRLDVLRRRLRAPLDDPDDHATVAGFVIGALGEIPEVGASVLRDGHRFTVRGVDGPRVTEVEVAPASAPRAGEG